MENYDIKHRVTRDNLLPESYITLKTGDKDEGDQQCSTLEIHISGSNIEASTLDGVLELKIKGNFETATLLELLREISHE